ncbi:MAG: hypothetical protein CMB65_02610, partial [Euryarchaeota archaeon]|nr:hypothetical protein [Euryarchaeota archaeon]
MLGYLDKFESFDKTMMRDTSNIGSKYEKSKKIRFFLLIIAPLLLGLFAFGFFIIVGLIAGLLWRLTTRIFLRFVAPIYAKAISQGDKFIIRFSDAGLPELESRRERWNMGGERANGSLLLMVFLISLLSAQYVDMAATGQGMENFECSDGGIVAFSYVNDGDEDCADGSDEDVLDPVMCPGDVCMASPTERFSEAFLSAEVLLVLMFAPIVTCVMGPLFAIKDSSLSIVDRETKSINPIGGKLLDMTNAATGFGALVVGGKTLWTMATASGSEFGESVGMVIMGLFLFGFMFWFFYHPIWISAVIYTKKHNSYVRRFDDLITSSGRVEFHEVQYDGNKIVIEAADEMTQPSIGPASPPPIAPTSPPPIAPTSPPPIAPTSPPPVAP